MSIKKCDKAGNHLSQEPHKINFNMENIFLLNLFKL